MFDVALVKLSISMPLDDSAVIFPLLILLNDEEVLDEVFIVFSEEVIEAEDVDVTVIFEYMCRFRKRRTGEFFCNASFTLLKSILTNYSYICFLFE